jgi:hypothetical protein
MKKKYGGIWCMIESVESEIMVGGVEFRKKITAAKRIWSNSKREIVYGDKIDKDEAVLFNEDVELFKLVVERERLEKEIIKRIDTILVENR